MQRWESEELRRHETQNKMASGNGGEMRIYTSRNFSSVLGDIGRCVLL